MQQYPARNKRRRNPQLDYRPVAASWFSCVPRHSPLQKSSALMRRKTPQHQFRALPTRLAPQFESFRICSASSPLAFGPMDVPHRVAQPLWLALSFPFLTRQSDADLPRIRPVTGIQAARSISPACRWRRDGKDASPANYCFTPILPSSGHHFERCSCAIPPAGLKPTAHAVSQAYSRMAAGHQHRPGNYGVTSFPGRILIEIRERPSSHQLARATFRNVSQSTGAQNQPFRCAGPQSILENATILSVQLRHIAPNTWRACDHTSISRARLPPERRISAMRS